MAKFERTAEAAERLDVFAAELAEVTRSRAGSLIKEDRKSVV